jgi:hypothetical protein
MMMKPMSGESGRVGGGRNLARVDLSWAHGPTDAAHESAKSRPAEDLC